MKTNTWLGAAIAAWMTGAAAAQPAATLFLDRDGTPVVRYALAGPTSEGRFVDARTETHDVARRPFWSFDKACYAIAARGITKLSDRCGPAEVRLAWDGKNRDRIYPGVVRLRNGGVLVATQYLQPLTNDGNLIDWKVEAPPGGVVLFRDEKSATSITLGARQFSEDGRGYAYLGPDDFLEMPAGRALVDPGVPEAISRELFRTAPMLMSELGRRLGRAPEHRPTLFLSWQNRDDAGDRQLQADVVPGAVIRFGLSGASWGMGDPGTAREVRKLAAHEIVHFWNGELYRPVSWAASWVSEGNAELLSLAALHAIGEMSADEAADHVATAFNECTMMARGRSWSELYHHEKHFGKGPYACGLAFQFAAVAVAAQADPAVDAFEFWKRTWAQYPRYFEAAVPAYFVRAGQEDAARLFGALFTDKSTKIEDVFRRAVLELPGMRSTFGVSPASFHGLRQQLMVALMQADCQGNISFNTFDDRYEIAAGSEILCKTFRKGQVFREVEGENPFQRTSETIAKANTACKAGNRVRLKTDDGAEVALPCPSIPFPDESSLAQLAPDQVARILAGPR